MTDKSISERLIDAAEDYMQEYLEESVYQGRAKARTALERLALEVEERMSCFQNSWDNMKQENDEREELWRELDAIYQRAGDGDPAILVVDWARFNELRKQLGLSDE